MLHILGSNFVKNKKEIWATETLEHQNIPIYYSILMDKYISRCSNLKSIQNNDMFDYFQDFVGQITLRTNVHSKIEIKCPIFILSPLLASTVSYHMRTV